MKPSLHPHDLDNCSKRAIGSDQPRKLVEEVAMSRGIYFHNTSYQKHLIGSDPLKRFLGQKSRAASFLCPVGNLNGVIKYPDRLKLDCKWQEVSKRCAYFF